MDLQEPIEDTKKDFLDMYLILMILILVNYPICINIHL